MAELVALDLPGGPDFVDALQRVWDAGDAAFPIDRRLPTAEAARVMASIAPTAVIEADGERRSLEGGQPAAPGDAVVVATSGTTGFPKGVVHTHDSVRASADATSTALNVDPSTDTWLACLPLAHIGGLAVVMRSLVTDTPVVAHDGFDAARVMEAIESGVTLASLVTKALNEIDTTRFRTILIGGAAPPPERPSNVIATYGMTETGSGCVYDRYPLDGLEMQIASDDHIQLRGPMLLRAYRGNLDGAGFVERDPRIDDGWFDTGDLGRWRDDGLIHVEGRAGDVIVTGGEKVWPSRVEPLLEAHPGIAELAVVGRPDPDWGHQVTVVAVAAADTTATGATAPPSLDELRELVKADLPVWYAPRALEWVDALPRTALGKIRRHEL